jgi:phosphate/sulfate permease
MDAWFISIVLLSFLMSFSIGANDAANGLATSYGSNALSLQKLIIIGGIAEFFGAMFLADKVALTLCYDIIKDLADYTSDEQKRLMFAVTFSSFLFIMSSSLFKVPVSGTHAVVGSLMGAGLASYHLKSISFSKLKTIMACWIISPLTAACLSCVMMMYVSAFVLNTKKTFTSRLVAIQLVFGVCVLIVVYLLFAIVGDKPSNDTDLSNPSIFVLLLIFGLLAARTTLVIIASNYSKSKDSPGLISSILKAILMPWSNECIKMLTVSIDLEEEQE